MCDPILPLPDDPLELSKHIVSLPGVKTKSVLNMFFSMVELFYLNTCLNRSHMSVSFWYSGHVPHGLTWCSSLHFSHVSERLWIISQCGCWSFSQASGGASGVGSMIVLLHAGLLLSLLQ